MRRIIWTALLIVVPSARAGDAWHVEFEEGRSAAKAQGKDLLIDFGGSDWCLPCKWLKDRVLSREAFIERAGREFVLVDIDLPVRTPIPADRKSGDTRSYRSVTGSTRSRRSCWRCPMAGPTRGRPTARHARPPNRTGSTSSRSMSGAGDSARGWRVRGRSKAGRGPRHWPRDSARSIRGSSPVLRGRRGRVRKADPSDATGYLAFLDGRRALDEFQAGMDLHHAAIDPNAVDSPDRPGQAAGRVAPGGPGAPRRGRDPGRPGPTGTPHARRRGRRPGHADPGSTAATSSCSTPTRSRRSADGSRKARPTRARESPSITPCTGSSSSTCRIPTNGRAARHSSPASASANSSATGTAAPCSARPRNSRARPAPGVGQGPRWDVLRRPGLDARDHPGADPRPRRQAGGQEAPAGGVLPTLDPMSRVRHDDRRVLSLARHVPDQPQAEDGPEG